MKARFFHWNLFGILSPSQNEDKKASRCGSTRLSSYHVGTRELRNEEFKFKASLGYLYNESFFFFF